ncbi:cell wall protein IFF6-like [Penaeus chinensis]|uniref:cell wall protein IFF6-like n=1 Tax=Penaeus chinensis TaxID=139456 RepID=UPI001FB60FB9|nr:cell wall protein IFF6-like [Penaeus chinensis]
MRKGSSFWCTVASLAVLLLAFSDTVAGDDTMIVMDIQQELKHIDDSLDKLLLLVNPETTTDLPPSTVSSDTPASPGSSVGSSVEASTTLASVGSSAQSSSTQAPAESSSTQAPTESSSTQAPAESSSTQEPTESSSTQAPAESSSTQEPTESSSTQTPTVSSSNAPPEQKESFEENQSSSSEQPEPSSSEQPEPSSSEKPEPSSSEQPQSSSSEQPQSSSSEQPQSSSGEPTSTVPPIPVCTTNENEDLCLRLTSVLDDIEAVTRTVADGAMGQSELDELRNCSTRLDDVIVDMHNDTDFIASSVDVEALMSRKDALDQVLTKAEEAVEAVLSSGGDDYDPTLAIVLGTLGGLLAVGIIGYVGFAFYKKKQAKKARLNDNPMRSMERGSGQDNSAFAGSSSRLN